ncbi:MAG: UDP-4-amino-4,6-dideoxy-N-acetyl-beta-L-altrosamine transaminase [Gammaproteobacteria bacterium]|jgi:dTDP-4-amino-4,6-dideoxygalactose transaminase|nr:UDP-4-amino-4,6-dideoxy-N-acetyl-beta-L-altrosamine transaminase [Gammaproteobacteria bacterium]
MADEQQDPFIIFGAPDIRDDEVAEVADVLHSGWLGTGPRVARFESDFAQYKGVGPNQVAAVNSCTAGLHVSMIAAGLGPGDEVLTTAMTFCATANAIIHAGATPVPVDIDPLSQNINVELIRDRITDRTRAIVPVHFAGRPCDMDGILALAEEHGLVVIEDCAHAIETQWKGRAAGTFGEFGCFSFYVTKNITTGEGGMVLAKSEADIERIKVLALHGMTKDAWHRFGDEGYKHYQVVEAGFKYNMMDLQAAIGIHQLRRIEDCWNRREQVWKQYQREFATLPVACPADPELHTRHAYHLYTLALDADVCGIGRDDFIAEMSKAGVGVGVHYLSLASHPHYQQRFGWRPGDYPVAQTIGERTVSLPLSAKLTDIEIERILETTHRVLTA